MLFRRLFGKSFRSFFGDRLGNVAPIFAIAMVPVIGFAGAAVDYSRANAARTSMQTALDATALFLSKEAQGLSPEQVSQKGQAYFDSIFKSQFAKNVTLNTAFVSLNGNFTINVSATADVDTTVARVLGVDQMKIGSSSEVVWGLKRLELALVLDVTGSMAAQNRMVELKKATKNLLETLENAAKQSGKADAVKVAIVPFAAHVNIAGVANANTTWLDWTHWTDQPEIISSWLSTGTNQRTWDLTGPGASCPFTNSSHGFRCTNGLAGSSNDSVVSTIPSSGSTSGLICPSRDNGARNSTLIGAYHTGCYTSVAKAFADWYPVTTGSSASCGSVPSPSQCQCSGSGSSRVCVFNPTSNWQSVATGSAMTCGSLSSSDCQCQGSGSNKVCKQKAYNHDWRPAPKSAWAGCVRDRNQNFDVNSTSPSTAISSTQYTNVNGQNESYGRAVGPNTTSNNYQPVQNFYCPPPTVGALTTSWSALHSKVDSLEPLGATNIAIGLTWGMNAMSSAVPMTQATPDPKPADLDKVIVLMTDGENTLNRWSGTGSSCSNCDPRTALACSNAKAAGYKLYTVRLMEGNENLLRACASTPDMYFNVETASQLNAVFNTIAKNLASLRISK
jgi:Flp pilus assembly protein TadG